MRVRRIVLGVLVVVTTLFLSVPASAQSVAPPSTAPAAASPRTRPAPTAFLWIPLILVAGSVYAVRVFIRPISRRDR